MNTFEHEICCCTWDRPVGLRHIKELGTTSPKNTWNFYHVFFGLFFSEIYCSLLLNLLLPLHCANFLPSKSSQNYLGPLTHSLIKKKNSEHLFCLSNKAHPPLLFSTVIHSPSINISFDWSSISTHFQYSILWYHRPCAAHCPLWGWSSACHIQFQPEAFLVCPRITLLVMILVYKLFMLCFKLLTLKMHLIFIIWSRLAALQPSGLSQHFFFCCFSCVVLTFIM